MPLPVYNSVWKIIVNGVRGETGKEREFELKEEEKSAASPIISNFHISVMKRGGEQ